MEVQYLCTIFVVLKDKRITETKTRIMKQIITTSTNDALVAAHIRSITNTTGSALKGVSTAMLIEEAKRQMRNGVCSFIYKKKDGSIRMAMGTLDRNVLNATLCGNGTSPETWGCCYYHDIIKGAARSFRWANLIAVLS